MKPSPLFPLFIAAILVAVDVASIVWRRTASVPWWVRFTGWVTRPLAACALVNAYFRVQPWSRFKFNPRTFPLYANPWENVHRDPVGTILAVAAAVAAVALVLFLLHVALSESRFRPGRVTALWVSLIAAQLILALAPDGWHGPLYPWETHYKTYAWAARRHVESPQQFLRDFEEIQPGLPVHARSHPPGGTLLSYWTQRVDKPASATNVLRLLVLANLNFWVLYGLGRSVFDEHRRALLAATLAAAMPAAVVYSTYSQDTIYAVGFNLYLLLGVLAARGGLPLFWAGLAGPVLFVITMFNYSWSILATIVALFVLIERWRRGEPLGRIVTIVGLPPVVALVPHLVVRWAHGFDYLGAYEHSYRFHVRFYPFDDIHDWWIALIGGQVEFLVCLGPLVASAFLVFLFREAPRRRDTLNRLVLCALAIYTIPVLVGPNPLKLETARSWYWMSTFPVLVTAEVLSPATDHRRGRALLATGTSLATALVLLFFLNFGA